MAGKRFNLEEVQRSLSSFPGVQDLAVVDVRAGEAAQPILVLLFISTGANAATDLARMARARLPNYMRPFYYFPVEQLPRTRTGKVAIILSLAFQEEQLHCAFYVNFSPIFTQLDFGACRELAAHLLLAQALPGGPPQAESEKDAVALLEDVLGFAGPLDMDSFFVSHGILTFFDIVLV